MWEVAIAGRKTNTWYEGVITRAPCDRRPPHPGHRVRSSDNDTVTVDFFKSPPATSLDPTTLLQTAYCIFGTPDQHARIAAVAPPPPVVVLHSFLVVFELLEDKLHLSRGNCCGCTNKPQYMRSHFKCNLNMDRNGFRPPLGL